jgi:hypothetical protein
MRTTSKQWTAIDLTGQTFGRWTVIKRADRATQQIGDGHCRWLCECECGTVKDVSGNTLRNGMSKSCGCLTKEKHGPQADLAGCVFGKWTVVSLGEQRDGDTSYRWTCRCECGIVRDVLSGSLLNGESKSCGCLAATLSSARASTHGMWQSREWRSWQLMRQRCNNKNAKGYHRYGDRGKEPAWPGTCGDCRYRSRASQYRSPGRSC